VANCSRESPSEKFSGQSSFFIQVSEWEVDVRSMSFQRGHFFPYCFRLHSETSGVCFSGLRLSSPDRRTLATPSEEKDKAPLKKPNGPAEVEEMFGNPANSDGTVNEAWKGKNSGGEGG